MKADPERRTIEDFAYPEGKSVDAFRIDAERLAEGGSLDTQDETALFLAAMVAEPRRNLNTHVIHLLILKAGGKERFYDESSMTTGGTAAGDKPRDPTLRDVPGALDNASGDLPPVKVTDKDVKRVRERYKKHCKGVELAAMITDFGEATVKAELVDLLVKEAQL
jgi:hypothetical protein